MSKVGWMPVSRGSSDMLLGSGQGSRRWPFFAILLSVIFLGLSPWLYSRIVPRLYNDQNSDNSPLSTPWEMIYNPFGDNHTYERAVEIANCTNTGWIKPPFLALTSNNDTLKDEDCPSYFHLIEKDLAPWKEKGITRANIEMAKAHAGFRAVIWDGKLYIDRFESCFGNRALFTTWGMLLVLEKYKGQVPDVELMFNCEDRPRIPKSEEGPDGPAVLFGYNSNSQHYDIPFPDWTFWGWSELMIQSWDEERGKIFRGSQQMDWSLKSQNAYWGGNPFVGDSHRPQLLKCKGVGRTEIRVQDWRKELPMGKQNSKLENQCTHRYMIYVEGNAWSVSLKYIMACGSPTLVISPEYYDFFSRGLQEWVHYIPIRPPDYNELCAALDNGVEFGETNETEAIRIGKAGQNFTQKEIAMDSVYDYVFHLLLEYSKLQRFQPSIQHAVHLVTLDHVLCLPAPPEREALQEAWKDMPSGTTPCHMPKNIAADFKGFEWEDKRQ